MVCISWMFICIPCLIVKVGHTRIAIHVWKFFTYHKNYYKLMAIFTTNNGYFILDFEFVPLLQSHNFYCNVFLRVD